MKQRLCLAKTLVHDPPVLILDEPSSGLDPRARLEVKALLKELRRMGKTILISSHILTELADCCTSIGIIERGQLLMHGPIDEVYRQIRGNRIIEVRFVEQHGRRRCRLIRSDPKIARRAADEPPRARSSWTATTSDVPRCCANSSPPTCGLRLLRRKRAHAGRRVHDGHQGAGDLTAVPDATHQKVRNTSTLRMQSRSSFFAELLHDRVEIDFAVRDGIHQRIGRG